MTKYIPRIKITTPNIMLIKLNKKTNKYCSAEAMEMLVVPKI